MYSLTHSTYHYGFSSSCGDEGQAALAIVQASMKDCGVYQCTIQNEYGTDSTDFLLSPEGEHGPGTFWKYVYPEKQKARIPCMEGLLKA